jgi:ubiquinone/menaquinone biosynthesis C-methylase UbiE
MNQTNSPKEIFWSRFANDFEKHNNYVAGSNEIELIKNRLLESKELRKTLELGCGDGVFTKTIASNSDFLIATDWSDEMIKVAKEKFKDSEIIELKKEDCLNLSFTDNSFDTILMANLLHVILTPEKVLEECKRVLKSNGNLIILSFTMHGMSFFNKMGMLYRYMKTYGKPPKESSVLTIQRVKDMLDKVGFVTEKMELIGNKMKCVYAIAKNK